MSRLIPIYYHIPKCAGSYVIRRMSPILRTVYRNKCSIDDLIIVTPEGLIVARAICSGLQRAVIEDNQISLHEKYPRGIVCKVDYQYLVEHIKELPIEIRALTIEARGFSFHEEIINQLLHDHNRLRFIVLRETFSRTLSMYNYLTSEQSKHERTHGLIKSATFEDYLTSYEIEDCWLMRNLLSLPDNKVLDEDDFKLVCETVDTMVVDDINNVDQLLSTVFRRCYGIINLPIRQPVNALTDIKKINHETIDQRAMDKFRERTQWDHKIYNRYVNKSLS